MAQWLKKKNHTCSAGDAGTQVGSWVEDPLEEEAQHPRPFMPGESRGQEPERATVHSA